MDKMAEILGRMNFTEHTFKPLSPEDMEKRKVDDFNSSPGSLNEDDGYNCDICHNKGIIMRAARSHGIWTNFSRDCKCMTVRRSIMRMKRSGLKDIIKDYTFGKFEATEPWQQTIKTAAMDYAKRPEGWFYIGGQSGSGKTHICTAICREFLLEGKEVRYMLWRDDVARLKAVVNDHEEYGKLIGALKDVEVLYIDDLFKTGKGPDGMAQKPTTGDINVAFEILNHRYNDPTKLTILSSECTINDILGIDEAVGGRIFERAKVFSLKQDRSRNYRLRGVVEL